jgi:hypothetical protein
MKYTCKVVAKVTGASSHYPIIYGSTNAGTDVMIFKILALFAKLLLVFEKISM